MLPARRQDRTHPAFLHVDAPILPGWVCEQLGAPVATDACAVAATPISSADGIDLSVRQSDKLVLITACVRNAVRLTPLSLQQRTTEAYQTIRSQLTASEHRYPIRIWNLIPDIHGAMSDGIDRYMVFNAGRFTAYHD